MLYEYFDTIEREKAVIFQEEEAVMEAEDEVIEENMAWAEEEERKELDALKAKKAAEEVEANAEWMKEQIEKEKKRLGDDTFGEDLSFSE